MLKLFTNLTLLFIILQNYQISCGKLDKKLKDNYFWTFLANNPEKV